MDASLKSQNVSSVHDDHVFRAFAETTRRRILQLLSREELNVSELVAILRQPQSTISRHLRVLRTAGLLRDRRAGTTSFYRVIIDDHQDVVGKLLCDWIRKTPLPDSMARTLERVVRRRDQSQGFFDRLGRRWDELRSAAFGEVFTTEAFLSLLPPTWTVADIGTGTGYLLPLLAASFETVIGVDPADTMLECARQRVREAGRANVTFHQGDLSQLPIEDGVCDLVIACLVLHHVVDPPAALNELHRIVRAGGRLLLVEQQLHENQDFFETMQDRWWGFDASDLAEQVVAAGFDGVRHHPLNSAAGRSRSVEAPGLFVLTAERGSR
jgi:ArsR family transcriptional regulator